jgi:Fe-S cluster biogenesis protein NfuA
MAQVGLEFCERGLVADNGGFQEQVRKLGELVTQFDEMPESPQKTAARELVQLLMEVHSQGLERMMEVVFESRESGGALIDRLGKDEVAGGLLLLYSLHPDSLETRVQTAVESMRSRLRKLSCTIELLGIDDGSVRVHVTKGGHSCGSSTSDLRAVVENGMYEFAPDVTSLEISGLDEPSFAGFVALESLLGHSLVGPSHDDHALQAGGGR